jgi:hypothetical protein
MRGGFNLRRNMQSYSEFPPIKYFIRVLKSCPKSALLYVQVWKNRGKSVKRRDIRKDYLMSPTMFRNLLGPLAFLNLVCFVENDEEFRIDVLGSQEGE